MIEEEAIIYEELIQYTLTKVSSTSSLVKRGKIIDVDSIEDSTYISHTH